jgi:hypothetical protein
VARYLTFLEQARYGLAPIEEHLTRDISDHTPCRPGRRGGRNRRGAAARYRRHHRAFPRPRSVGDTGKYVTESRGCGSEWWPLAWIADDELRDSVTS